MTEGKTEYRRRLIAWLFALGLVIMYAVAIERQLFTRSSWLDILMHFSGGAIVALIFFSHLPPPRASRVFIVLSAVGVAAAIGVFWEIYELSIDRFLIPNFMGGREDTLLDLIMDILGGASFGLYLTYADKERADEK